MNMFSFIFLFDLNNTNRAVPLLDRRPASSAGNDIALFKYNSVRITLAPQLGINPISEVINEPKILFLRRILDSNSSPT